MIVVLSGAPGAGKGTQADLLVARSTGLRKVSTGDALRSQVARDTQVGREADALMREGKLVPDSVLSEILGAELAQSRGRIVILDGYPRNVIQAESLASLGKEFPVLGCIHLSVDRKTLVERLSGRRICQKCAVSLHVLFDPPVGGTHCPRCGGIVVQRPDDEASKVSVRLDIFERDTKPVLDFYRQAGLYCEVDGVGETEVVYERLSGQIAKLVGSGIRERQDLVAR